MTTALTHAPMAFRRVPARVAHLLWAALQRYLAAGGLRQGAAVSFYATFSIAPLLVVVTGALVWLLGDDAAQTALFNAVSRLVGGHEARSLAELFKGRSLGALRLDGAVTGSWLALGTAVLGATGVFVELRAALQAMLGESERSLGWRHLLRVRLFAVGIVLGCGVILPAAVLAQAVSLLALHWAAQNWPPFEPLLGVAENLWSWGVTSLLFALTIRWLPDARVPMRHALAGAALGAALFVLGRHAISLYIVHSALQSALGAAGAFAVLLLWIYWSSQIFLISAAIAVELGHPTQPVARALA